MKIAVPSLPPGRQVIRSSAPALAYGEVAAAAGLRFLADIDVEAAVNRMQDELFVNAAVSTRVRADCARCLEPFEMLLAARLEALFLPDYKRDAFGPQAHAIQAESQRILYYSEGVVDLGGPLLEALTLAVPMKPLCRADCRGLCPTCGRNLNESPCGCAKDDDFNRPFKGLFGGS